MSKENEEKKQLSKKFSLKSLQVDKKFLIISLILLLSIVIVVFSTRDLFETNINDWTITQGSFKGEDGTLVANSFSYNWAYHKSKVAYGVWEWSYRTFTSGSASVIFIGLNQDEAYFSHCTAGYKLEIDPTKEISIKRIDGLLIENVLISKSYEFKFQETYGIRISRSVENNFTVYINGQFIFSTIDDTYTTSEVFELDWYNRHTLFYAAVTDAYDINSWSEYFVGIPISDSQNIFTKIALYTPFVALALVVLFYLFRLLLSEGSWTRFIVPLILAAIIGVGFGYLFQYLRSLVPEFIEPTPTSGPSGETYNSSTISPVSPPPSNSTTNGNGGGNGGIPPIEKTSISIILLVVSGLFIVMMVGFVMIDFFRKREDEFHEKVIEKDVRWLPKAEEKDYRKRVIRAYHKASYDLIDHGAKSEKSMTPGEFEEDSIKKFEIKEESLRGLTDLYEEARFSEHDIDPLQSDYAEDLSKNISSDLEKHDKIIFTKSSDFIETEDFHQKTDKKSETFVVEDKEEENKEE